MRTIGRTCLAIAAVGVMATAAVPATGADILSSRTYGGAYNAIGPAPVIVWEAATTRPMPRVRSMAMPGRLGGGAATIPTARTAPIRVSARTGGTRTIRATSSFKAITDGGALPRPPNRVTELALGS